MIYPLRTRRAPVERGFVKAYVLVATLGAGTWQALAQGADAPAAPSPAGQPAANPPASGQAPNVERPSGSPTAATTNPSSSGQVAIGEIPAGLPTVDQPAPTGQAPRKLSPGKGQTSWDTYMYEGPGYRYAVIDEVSQGQRLQITACGNDWCKVVFDGGRMGYIIAEVLTTGDPAKAEPGFLPNPATAIIPNPSGPCFDALQTEGNGGKMPTRYCQKAGQ